MEQLLIQGPNKLKGSIKISSSKNAVLPIMAATLLTKDSVSLKNLPGLADIKTMEILLKKLGQNVNVKNKNEKIFTLEKFKSHEAPYDLVKTMRASILVLGPLLARHGEATVSLPGGCAIGARPIDLHLQGLEQLGAKIEMKNGLVRAKTKKLKGSNINLKFPSVGATENIMMAATLAEGTTVLKNAAKEPEIEDLANFLIQMGANITGTGTSEITIEGVKKLHGAEYSIIPDRIEAATYLIAGLLTNSEIILENVRQDHLEILINIVTKMGANIECGENYIKVKKHKKLIGTDITTAPYPGFPTDMQAQLMVLATQAEGTTVISEHIFENRFMHVPELNRLGANISLKGNTAIIEGPSKLTGAPVMCTDLRASAALILAGLIAKNTTEIRRIYHLDRGYNKIDLKLKKIGANIKRVKTKKY